MTHIYFEQEKAEKYAAQVRDGFLMKSAEAQTLQSKIFYELQAGIAYQISLSLARYANALSDFLAALEAVLASTAVNAADNLLQGDLESGALQILWGAASRVEDYAEQKGRVANVTLQGEESAGTA